MKLDQLSHPHVDAIIESYERYCGGRVELIKNQTFGSIKDAIRKNNSSWRIGSKWDSQSKLEIFISHGGEIDVNFHPNFDPRDRESEQYNEALEAGRKFREEVSQLLSNI